MDELNNAGLKLFFNEDIYLIKETEKTNTPKEEKNLEPPTPEPIIAEEPVSEAIKFNYKGGNAKEIAIIINDDSNEFLNSTDETLLLNILKAIGLSLEDVAIINQHKTGTDWKEQLEYSKVIVFGILPGTYDLVTENYLIQESNKVSWLFSDSLFSLGSNKELKGKLWGKLQELF